MSYRYYYGNDVSNFSIKRFGESVQYAKSINSLREWDKKGYLICSKQDDSIFLYRGEKEDIKIKIDNKMIKNVLKYWDKGYRFKRKKEIQPHKEKIKDTLTQIAEVLEPTNAQKAKYFRTTVPYKYGNCYAIDFPSDCNDIYKVAERYKTLDKPSNIITLYHGTSIYNIPSIIKRGLRPGRRGGLLGKGIYVGRKYKALHYSDLIVFEVKVLLGNCKELEDVEELDHKKNIKYDSLHIGAGQYGKVHKGFLYNEEWILRTAKQVEITKLLCLKTELRG